MKPSKLTVRRGKKRRVAVVIRNSGDATARDLRICLQPFEGDPVRALPEGVTLAAGETKVRRFTVRAKRNARPGLRQLRVTVAASGEALGRQRR